MAVLQVLLVKIQLESFRSVLNSFFFRGPRIWRIAPRGSTRSYALVYSLHKRQHCSTRADMTRAMTATTVALLMLAAMCRLSDSSGIPLRQRSAGGGPRGVRSWDVAMARSGTYDFTVSPTLRTNAEVEQPPLFPKIEDIPVVSNVYAMYKDHLQDKKNKESQSIGRVDTSGLSYLLRHSVVCELSMRAPPSYLSSMLYIYKHILQVYYVQNNIECHRAASICKMYICIRNRVLTHTFNPSAFPKHGCTVRGRSALVEIHESQLPFNLLRACQCINDTADY